MAFELAISIRVKPSSSSLRLTTEDHSDYYSNYLSNATSASDMNCIHRP